MDKKNTVILAVALACAVVVSAGGTYLLTNKSRALSPQHSIYGTAAPAATQPVVAQAVPQSTPQAAQIAPSSGVAIPSSPTVSAPSLAQAPGATQTKYKPTPGMASFAHGNLKWLAFGLCRAMPGMDIDKVIDGTKTKGAVAKALGGGSLEMMIATVESDKRSCIKKVPDCNDHQKECKVRDEACIEGAKTYANTFVQELKASPSKGRMLVEFLGEEPKHYCK